ncbi:MAG TPA: hypothetical protein VNK89_03400 [Thermoflexus sp.]|nr:hypothetical protein [Thermoflexus sp.]
MSRIRWFGPVLLLISACAGRTPTIFPSPTSPLTVPVTETAAPSPLALPTPTPPPPSAASPTPSVSISCAAPTIPVHSGAVRAAEGCLHVHLEPNQVWEKDGFDLAAAVGYGGPQPPCAAFYLKISWQVTAGDGTGVKWTVIRQGEEIQTGQGSSGEDGSGCGFYRLHNNSGGPIDVDVRVVVDLMQ